MKLSDDEHLLQNWAATNDTRLAQQVKRDRNGWRFVALCGLLAVVTMIIFLTR